MVGIAELLLGVGVALALAGMTKKVIKAKKPRMAALVGGLLVALVGASMGGYLAFLSGAPGDGPKAGGLFDAFWVAGDSATDRAVSTEVVSADQKTITYTMIDALMDGLGDVNLGADILNKNVGETTDLWAAEVSIDFIGTVIVSGIPTPVANYTADRTRFNIAYADDDASGTWTQIHDKFFSNDVVTGGAGSLSIDLPIDPAVADDLPAGGTFELRYMVAGVLLTCILQET